MTCHLQGLQSVKVLSAAVLPLYCPCTAGSLTEYKYVLVDAGGSPLAWQDGNNSVLALREGDARVEVFDSWWVLAAPALLAG